MSSLRSAPVSVGPPLQKSGKDSALPERPSRFCQMEWPFRQKTSGFRLSPDCRDRVRELLLGSNVRTSALSLVDFHPLLLPRSSCVEARPGTVQTGLDEESPFRYAKSGVTSPGSLDAFSLDYHPKVLNGRFRRQFRPRRKTGVARGAERVILCFS